jgi:hypothetical protein
MTAEMRSNSFAKFGPRTLANIRLPRGKRRGRRPVFAADVVGEGWFQIAEHALKRDPYEDLVGHSRSFESFRGGFVDHCLTFGVLH